jgi:hypothetical protein
VAFVRGPLPQGPSAAMPVLPCRTLANAAVELPEKDHPARRVIEAFKTAQHERLVQLCAAAALAEPEMLADELFLLLEGARVAAQSMGRKGLGDRLVRMGEAMINTHTTI